MTRPTEDDGDPLDEWVMRWLEAMADPSADPEAALEAIREEIPPELLPEFDARIAEMRGLARENLAVTQGGSTIAGFELVEKLGEGASGVVWRVLDANGERFALKVIHPHYRQTEEGRRRLRVEIQASSQVVHEGIVPVLDVVDGPDGYALVQPLIGVGETLARELELAARNRGEGTVVEVLERLLPALRGLAALHEQGIAHLDLKPSNLLLDPAIGYRIADLGLARLEEASDLTRSSQVLGTPAYMSPELAEGKRKHADLTADVWAIGVILQEVVTGRRPFDAATTAQVLAAVVTEEPPAIRVPIPGLSMADSRALREVIQRCLDRSPSHRYPHASALLADLEAVLHGGSFGGQAWDRRLSTWYRRNRRSALGALAALVVVITSATVAWREQDQAARLARTLSLTSRLVTAAQDQVADLDDAEIDAMLADLLELSRDAAVGTDVARASVLHSVGKLFIHQRARRASGVELLERSLVMLGGEDPRRSAEIHEALAYAAELSGASREVIDHLECVVDALSDATSPRDQERRARAILNADIEKRMNWFHDEREEESVIDAACQVLMDSLPTDGTRRTARQAQDELLVTRTNPTRAGDQEDRLAFVEGVVRDLEDQAGVDHIWTIDAVSMLAQYHYSIGRHEDALEHFLDAFERSRRSLGPNHVLTLKQNLGIAQEYLHTGEVDLAIEHYERSIEGLKRIHGGHTELTLRISIGLGAAYNRSCQFEDAAALARELQGPLAERHGPDSGSAMLALRLEVDALHNLGGIDRMREVLDQLWNGHRDSIAENPDQVLRDMARMCGSRYAKWDCPTAWSAESRERWDAVVVGLEGVELGEPQAKMFTKVNHSQSLWERAIAGDVEGLLDLERPTPERTADDWQGLIRAIRVSPEEHPRSAELEVLAREFAATAEIEPLTLLTELALLDHERGDSTALKEIRDRTPKRWAQYRAEAALAETSR